MKRLVTGGTGLVGSAIIADVKVGRNYDLTNPEICDSMFNEHKPTHVIHCAAKVGGLGGNMNFTHARTHFLTHRVTNTV